MTETTDTKLAELKELHARATKGEWTHPITPAEALAIRALLTAKDAENNGFQAQIARLTAQRESLTEANGCLIRELAGRDAVIASIEDRTKRVRGMPESQAYGEVAACDGINHFYELQEIDGIITDARDSALASKEAKHG